MTKQNRFTHHSCTALLDCGRIATLMRRYIANVRSTVGVTQKNAAALSVDDSSLGERARARKAE